MLTATAIVGLELMFKIEPGLWPKFVSAELMTDEEVVSTAAVAEFVKRDEDAPEKRELEETTEGGKL